MTERLRVVVCSSSVPKKRGECSLADCVWICGLSGAQPLFVSVILHPLYLEYDRARFLSPSGWPARWGVSPPSTMFPLQEAYFMSTSALGRTPGFVKTSISQVARLTIIV